MRKIALLFSMMLLSMLSAQPTLRVLTDMGSRIYDINNNGYGVHPNGYYDYTSDTSSSAEEGVTATNRLNNSADVVGLMPYTATDGSGLDQAAYRKGGTWVPIGWFPGDVPANSWFGNANAISPNSKYVSGQISVSVNRSYPYLYNTENGTLTKLTNGDDLWVYGRGEGVNDAGYVSGFVDREDIFGGGTFWVPVYFDPSGNVHYIDFDTPEYGEAADINNAGIVVGYKGEKAFFYNITSGDYKSFGSTPSMINPRFTSVSETGMAIGYSGDLGNREVIVYYEGLAKPIFLKDYLISKGVEVTTIDGKLGTGMGVSDDGRYICGFDNAAPVFFASGWIVHLDELPTEPGCLSDPNGMYPSSVFNPSCDGSNEVVTNEAVTGQYSLIHLTAGKQYTFSTSVATDFITISNAEGNQILKYGSGSVTYIADSDKEVRYYVHLADDCSSSSVTRTKYVSCTNAQGCHWTVHVFDSQFGDEVSWTLKNEAGDILLTGSGYGMEYDDTQSIFANGPLTFYIENYGFFNDNTPSYTVSNGTEVLVTGSLNAQNQEATYYDLNCNSMAVHEADDSSSFKYFPNPVNNILKINSKKSITSVDVYSLDGKLIFNKGINSNTTEIDLRHLKTGVYLILAKFKDHQSKSFRIIKK